ncbi:hypothetical protein LCGC14_0310950 [marine sediment metagenome]|uniref:Uncharacterized protein n=1 Tax=marine sediment metagenome TaxID=412755 RepID=A0A0F9U4U6_9ZZZZ
MLSRKLAGAIAGMVGVNTIIALTAYQGVPVEIALSGIAAVAGLGGFQVFRQARIDEAGGGAN